MASGGEHFQVVGVEGQTGPQTIQLNHPQAPALPSQQRHTQERTQIQRNHGGRQHQVGIAAHVLAEQTDAFFKGAADNGSAVRIIALPLDGVAAVLGTDLQLFALAEQYHAAIGLRKQAQQMLKQATEQRLHLERVAQMLSNFQNHL